MTLIVKGCSAITWLNDLRARHGAPPLTFDPLLAHGSQHLTNDWEYDDNYNWNMPNQDWIFEWGPMWPVNAGDNWMSGINSQWNPNYALNTYSEKNRFGYIGWIVLVPRTQASFPFLVAL